MGYMKKITTKILEYTAIFEKDPQGGYVVSIPALPGCVTQGETYEEAEIMVKDAIEGYLAVLKDEQENIPLESPNTIISRISVINPLY